MHLAGGCSALSGFMHLGSTVSVNVSPTNAFNPPALSVPPIAALPFDLLRPPKR
jgi:hypothetical protein